MPDHYIEYAKDYISVNKYIKPVNRYMVDMMIPAKAVFKFGMLLLPVLWILKLVMCFVKRKKYNETYRRTNQLILILYTYSFGQMMMYTLLGALMDRYALAPFTTALIGMILDLYLLVRGKKYKIEKKEIKEDGENKGKDAEVRENA